MAKDFETLKKEAMNNRMVMHTIDKLAKLGYTCALSRSDDGVWVIDYAQPGDLDKPAIRIEGEKMILPKGSSMDLLELMFAAG